MSRLISLWRNLFRRSQVDRALLTRLREGMLHGVRPLDPISFLGSAAVFAAVALVASLVPAMRAASLNPVQALITR